MISFVDRDVKDLTSKMKDLAGIPADPPTKRAVCVKCCRPMTVCWCSSLPQVPLNLSSKITILQHPLEEKRNLRTARILELSCGPNHCQVIKSRKFNSKKFPELESVLYSNKEKPLLVYPSKEAIKLQDIEPLKSYNIIVIDGTWNQAKSMYHHSPELHDLTKVVIESKVPSSYVIRTQPLEGCLSTVEAAALVLSHVENDPEIYKLLTKPLDTLCAFQLQFGAVKHHSKEFLVTHGMYDKNKPVPKEIARRIREKKEQQNDET